MMMRPKAPPPTEAEGGGGKRGKKANTHGRYEMANSSPGRPAPPQQRAAAAAAAPVGAGARTPAGRVRVGPVAQGGVRSGAAPRRLDRQRSSVSTQAT